MNKGKRGKWSESDKNFISENAENMSVNDIAKTLNRDPESISKYIRKTLGLRVQKRGKVNTLSSGTEIQKTLIWGELKKELTTDELDVFIYHWNRIIIQFKEDVFPTEEMQIIDTIKLEILMGRSMKSQMESLSKINELKNTILEMKAKEKPEDFTRIDSLDRQLLAYKQAYELMHKEYNDLLARKSSMLKELKGTRDQRLKRIEDSKTTFIGWINEILTNPRLRKDLGEYIEKCRLAMNVEEYRLSKPYKFADTEDDLPLLTPENIIKLQKEEDKQDVKDSINTGS
jgi:translation initiation factor 2 beta subunit (eIF-2beta)/eIF-5